MNNKIEISTAEELQAIATDPDYRNKKGHIIGDFIQMQDIDLSSIDNFEPIGSIKINFNANFNGAFNGTFNGNGYTIKNLTINRPENNTVGLFGYIMQFASIENVKLVNANIKGDYKVGGLVGWMQNGFVTGHNIGGIVNGKSTIGGLVGYMEDGIVIGSNTGDVRGGSYIGGLVARIDGAIVIGYNTGNVKGTNFVGGLVGYKKNANVRGYNNGSVSGQVVIEHLVACGNYVSDNSDDPEFHYVKGFCTPNAKLNILSKDWHSQHKIREIDCPGVKRKQDYYSLALDEFWFYFVKKGSDNLGWIHNDNDYPTLNLVGIMSRTKST